MMNIQAIVSECGRITKEKGFDTTQHATQITLIATEVAEALECITRPANSVTGDFMSNIILTSAAYEAHRAEHKGFHQDDSTVKDQEHLLEELADICIRVFSYVGGNGMTYEFSQALFAKIEKNRARPHLHGKAF